MNGFLTTTAENNFRSVSTEIALIEENDNQSERYIVSKYLADIEANEDQQLQQLLQTVDNQIADLPGWETMPELIVTVPVVGAGNQERQSIKRFFEEIRKDPAVLEKEVRFVFLVNRPEGTEPDCTVKTIRKEAKERGIAVSLLEVDLPKGGGRTNEEIPEMAESDDQPMIGVIRNILDIAAMKVTLRCAGEQLPVVLQMDVDFEGFTRGGFAQIIKTFESYPKMQFLQCTSDWDSNDYPTDSDPLFKLGSDLMRMLPLVVKAKLNQPDNSIKPEIIFGEVIQRGIQVPQAQRMPAIAQKQSYRMLRFTADELDYYIRSTAATLGVDTVRSTANTIFKWSNRRAWVAWNEYGRPPVSQWSAETPFAVDDPVRGDTTGESNIERTEIDVINLTLARMPIPTEGVEEFRKKFETVISNLVGRKVSLIAKEPDSKNRVYYEVKLEG